MARTMDRHQVIERLRESKERLGQSDYDEGLEAGQEWARQSAEVRELKNLARLRYEDDWDLLFADSDYQSAISAAENLGPMIAGVAISPVSAVEFWTSACGADFDLYKITEAWLRGFAEGALEVWKDVEAEVEAEAGAATAA